MWVSAQHPKSSPDTATRPDQFLLEVEDPQAIEWAKQRSDNTARFVDHTVRARIEAGLNTPGRIPYVTRRGDYLYNFWRDESHPRGLWRRTTLEQYLAPETVQWEVLVDVDKLAADDGCDWVWKGAHVREHAFDRALLRLSRGGADAVVIREFDLEAKRFVGTDLTATLEDAAPEMAPATGREAALGTSESPFNVAEGKTQISWVDRDTVLIGTDFGPGSLTTAGYPARAHLWRRGQSLEDSEEFFAGKPDDLAVSAWALNQPGYEKIFVRRTIDFYRARTFVHTPLGLQILEVPEDAEVFFDRNWMFIIPRTPFAGIAAGGLGVIDLDDFLGGAREFATIFHPTPTTSLQDVSLSKSHLLLTVLDNVATTIYSVPLTALAQGVCTPLPLPALATARVVSTSTDSDEVWLGASSFTQPDTLYRWEAGDPHSLREVAAAPALFDAGGMTTRQHWATSADGTKIPYFITGRFDDNPHPCLVSAYGGFEVSLLPSYSFIRGIWMEQGNYLVQANLRGGGEFGPSWHEQVIGDNRIKVYEDHAAVLADIAARGYATASQIVVRGGSNGGLLTSVALTRYPELIGAAVIQVPLTDMLRYHTWSAGASWMAEYGDPDGAQRKVLASYSPLHNIALAPGSPAALDAAGGAAISLLDDVVSARDDTGAGFAIKAYPPVLVTTSTRDDRVHPAHARLFCLGLERAGQSVDYYENSSGGHAGAADNAQVAFMEALVAGWINAALAQGCDHP